MKTHALSLSLTFNHPILKKGNLKKTSSSETLKQLEALAGHIFMTLSPLSSSYGKSFRQKVENIWLTKTQGIRQVSELNLPEPSYTSIMGIEFVKSVEKGKEAYAKKIALLTQHIISSLVKNKSLLEDVFNLIPDLYKKMSQPNASLMHDRLEEELISEIESALKSNEDLSEELRATLEELKNEARKITLKKDVTVALKKSIVVVGEKQAWVKELSRKFLSLLSRKSLLADEDLKTASLEVVETIFYADNRQSYFFDPSKFVQRMIKHRGLNKIAFTWAADMAIATASLAVKDIKKEYAAEISRSEAKGNIKPHALKLTEKGKFTILEKLFIEELLQKKNRNPEKASGLFKEPYNEVASSNFRDSVKELYKEGVSVKNLNEDGLKVFEIFLEIIRGKELEEKEKDASRLHMGLKSVSEALDLEGIYARLSEVSENSKKKFKSKAEKFLKNGDDQNLGEVKQVIIQLLEGLKSSEKKSAKGTAKNTEELMTALKQIDSVIEDLGGDSRSLSPLAHKENIQRLKDELQSLINSVKKSSATIPVSRPMRATALPRLNNNLVWKISPYKEEGSRPKILKVFSVKNQTKNQVINYPLTKNTETLDLSFVKGLENSDTIRINCQKVTENLINRSVEKVIPAKKASIRVFDLEQDLQEGSSNKIYFRIRDGKPVSPMAIQDSLEVYVNGKKQPDHLISVSNDLFSIRVENNEDLPEESVSVSYWEKDPSTVENTYETLINISENSGTYELNIPFMSVDSTIVPLGVEEPKITLSEENFIKGKLIYIDPEKVHGSTDALVVDYIKKQKPVDDLMQEISSGVSQLFEKGKGSTEAIGNRLAALSARDLGDDSSKRDLFIGKINALKEEYEQLISRIESNDLLRVNKSKQSVDLKPAKSVDEVYDLLKTWEVKSPEKKKLYDEYLSGMLPAREAFSEKINYFERAGVLRSDNVKSYDDVGEGEEGEKSQSKLEQLISEDYVPIEDLLIDISVVDDIRQELSDEGEKNFVSDLKKLIQEQDDPVEFLKFLSRETIEELVESPKERKSTLISVDRAVELVDKVQAALEGDELDFDYVLAQYLKDEDPDAQAFLDYFLNHDVEGKKDVDILREATGNTEADSERAFEIKSILAAAFVRMLCSRVILNNDSVGDTLKKIKDSLYFLTGEKSSLSGRAEKDARTVFLEKIMPSSLHEKQGYKTLYEKLDDSVKFLAQDLFLDSRLKTTLLSDTDIDKYKKDYLEKAKALRNGVKKFVSVELGGHEKKLHNKIVALETSYTEATKNLRELKKNLYLDITADEKEFLEKYDDLSLLVTLREPIPVKSVVSIKYKIKSVLDESGKFVEEEVTESTTGLREGLKETKRHLLPAPSTKPIVKDDSKVTDKFYFPLRKDRITEPREIEVYVNGKKISRFKSKAQLKPASKELKVLRANSIRAAELIKELNAIEAEIESKINTPEIKALSNSLKEKEDKEFEIVYTLKSIKKFNELNEELIKKTVQLKEELKSTAEKTYSRTGPDGVSRSFPTDHPLKQEINELNLKILNVAKNLNSPDSFFMDTLHKLTGEKTEVRGSTFIQKDIETLEKSLTDLEKSLADESENKEDLENKQKELKAEIENKKALEESIKKALSEVDFNLKELKKETVAEVDILAEAINKKKLENEQTHKKELEELKVSKKNVLSQYKAEFNKLKESDLTKSKEIQDYQEKAETAALELQEKEVEANTLYSKYVKSLARSKKYAESGSLFSLSKALIQPEGGVDPEYFETVKASLEETSKAYTLIPKEKERARLRDVVRDLKSLIEELPGNEKSSDKEIIKTKLDRLIDNLSVRVKAEEDPEIKKELKKQLTTRKNQRAALEDPLNTYLARGRDLQKEIIETKLVSIAVKLKDALKGESLGDQSSEEEKNNAKELVLGQTMLKLFKKKTKLERNIRAKEKKLQNLTESLSPLKRSKREKDTSSKKANSIKKKTRTEITSEIEKINALIEEQRKQILDIESQLKYFPSDISSMSEKAQKAVMESPTVKKILKERAQTEKWEYYIENGTESLEKKVIRDSDSNRLKQQIEQSESSSYNTAQLQITKNNIATKIIEKGMKELQDLLASMQTDSGKAKAETWCKKEKDSISKNMTDETIREVMEEVVRVKHFLKSGIVLTPLNEKDVNGHSPIDEHLQNAEEHLFRHMGEKNVSYLVRMLDKKLGTVVSEINSIKSSSGYKPADPQDIFVLSELMRVKEDAEYLETLTEKINSAKTLKDREKLLPDMSKVFSKIQSIRQASESMKDAAEFLKLNNKTVNSEVLSAVKDMANREDLDAMAKEYYRAEEERLIALNTWLKAKSDLAQAMEHKDNESIAKMSPEDYLNLVSSGLKSSESIQREIAKIEELKASKTRSEDEVRRLTLELFNRKKALDSTPEELEAIEAELNIQKAHRDHLSIIVKDREQSENKFLSILSESFERKKEEQKALELDNFILGESDAAYSVKLIKGAHKNYAVTESGFKALAEITSDKRAQISIAENSVKSLEKELQETKKSYSSLKSLFVNPPDEENPGELSWKKTNAETIWNSHKDTVMPRMVKYFESSDDIREDKKPVIAARVLNMFKSIPDLLVLSDEELEQKISTKINDSLQDSKERAKLKEPANKIFNVSDKALSLLYGSIPKRPKALKSYHTEIDGSIRTYDQVVKDRLGKIKEELAKDLVSISPIFENIPEDSLTNLEELYKLKDNIGAPLTRLEELKRVKKTLEMQKEELEKDLGKETSPEKRSILETRISKNKVSLEKASRDVSNKEAESKADALITSYRKYFLKGQLNEEGVMHHDGLSKDKDGVYKESLPEIESGIRALNMDENKYKALTVRLESLENKLTSENENLKKIKKENPGAKKKLAEIESELREKLSVISDTESALARAKNSKKSKKTTKAISDLTKKLAVLKNEIKDIEERLNLTQKVVFEIVNKQGKIDDLEKIKTSLLLEKGLKEFGSELKKELINLYVKSVSFASYSKELILTIPDAEVLGPEFEVFLPDGKSVSAKIVAGTTDSYSVFVPKEVKRERLTYKVTTTEESKTVEETKKPTEVKEVQLIKPLSYFNRAISSLKEHTVNSLAKQFGRKYKNASEIMGEEMSAIIREAIEEATREDRVYLYLREHLNNITLSGEKGALPKPGNKPSGLTAKEAEEKRLRELSASSVYKGLNEAIERLANRLPKVDSEGRVDLDKLSSSEFYPIIKTFSGKDAESKNSLRTSLFKKSFMLFFSDVVNRLWEREDSTSITDIIRHKSNSDIVLLYRNFSNRYIAEFIDKLISLSEAQAVEGAKIETKKYSPKQIVEDSVEALKLFFKETRVMGNHQVVWEKLLSESSKPYSKFIADGKVITNFNKLDKETQEVIENSVAEKLKDIDRNKQRLIYFLKKEVGDLEEVLNTETDPNRQRELEAELQDKLKKKEILEGDLQSAKKQLVDDFFNRIKIQVEKEFFKIKESAEKHFLKLEEEIVTHALILVDQLKENPELNKPEYEELIRAASRRFSISPEDKKILVEFLPQLNPKELTGIS